MSGTTGRMRPARVALWGLGRRYEDAVGLLLLMRELGQVELVGATAAELPPYARLDGIPVMARDELVAQDFDLLLLMVAKPEQLLGEVVGEWGVPRPKVATSAILSVPGIDLRRYLRLRSLAPSIVSDSAWGGRVTARLELEERSPFVGCEVHGQDYLRLLADLPGHLACALVPRGSRLTGQGHEYPVMVLGDVPLHFTSDDPAKVEDIQLAWERRLAAFDMDAAFVEMATADPATEQAFEGLGAFERRVCLVPYASSLPHSIGIPMPPGTGNFRSVVMRTTMTWGAVPSLDLVRLLLGEPGAVRFEPVDGALPRDMGRERTEVVRIHGVAPVGRKGAAHD